MVISLSPTPKVCPAAVNTAFAEMSRVLVPGVVVVIALDSVTFPATTRFVLNVNVLVYPVHVNDLQVLVAPVLMLQFALASSNITSSATVGTAPAVYVGEGVELQSPAVPQDVPVLLK
jgi:hypothetical protein